MRRLRRGEGLEKRVDLGEGDWVTIRRHITVRDQEAITSIISDNSDLREVKKKNLRTGKIESAVEGLNFAVARRARLQVLVTAAGGPGFCGFDHEADPSHAHSEEGSNGCSPPKLDDAFFTDLDDETAAVILEAADAADPRPDTKESAHPTSGSEPTS